MVFDFAIRALKYVISFNLLRHNAEETAVTIEWKNCVNL